jgi:hypothetical protein
VRTDQAPRDKPASKAAALIRLRMRLGGMGGGMKKPSNADPSASGITIVSGMGTFFHFM